MKAEKPDLQVWDLTLRDGEQTPGLRFSPDDKVRIATLLDAVGVDCADVAFPSSSAEEREAVRRLLDAGLRMGINVTARMLAEDVELALALGARTINCMVPASDIHIEKKFGLSRRAVVDRMELVLGQAARRGLGVNFIAEDTSRADPAFAVELFKRAFDLGAKRLVICDTVGVMTPPRMGELVRAILHASDPAAAFAIHCHNDFGLATANTLAAVEAGVRIVTVTINGLGERAGNAALDQVVMAATSLLGLTSNIDTTKLFSLSKLVESISGIPIAPIQPLAGYNTFRHESGIHVAAMLKHVAAYEALDPASVGRTREYVFGKHSGRHQLAAFLAGHGLPHDEAHCDALLAAIKAHAPEPLSSRRQWMLAVLERYYDETLGLSDETLLELVERLSERGNATWARGESSSCPWPVPSLPVRPGGPCAPEIPWRRPWTCSWATTAPSPSASTPSRPRASRR
jgi:isopropylmalate/homocitrate/citramalate synthase